MSMSNGVTKMWSSRSTQERTFEYYVEAISLPHLKRKTNEIKYLLICSIFLILSPTLVTSQTSNATRCNLICPVSRLSACLPKSAPLSITLGVSDREVCHRHKDCFDGTSEQNVPVQQRPVNLILEQSVSLRLDQNTVTSASQYWQLYRVSSGQFATCTNYQNSSSLLSNITQTSSFIFNSSSYGEGTFYFAGEANNILRCTLGLRIRITVRRHNCVLSGDQICSNKGLCIANNNDTTATCKCCLGYNGTYCDEYDACVSNPCLNSGNCTDIIAGQQANFTCKCTPYYTGKRCETKIDYCEPSPCLNNATCNNRVLEQNYACTCQPGFTGRNCEINVNDCVSHNCSNNATCTDEVNGFRCQCSGNWTGKYCSEDINECNVIRCLNDATCINTPGSFYCSCPVNVTGKLCETDLYNDCVSSPCINGGKCNDLIGGFSCTCPQGYNGTRCQIDINECLSKPCSKQGTSRCIDGPGNFSCVCLPEYTGQRCDKFLDRCASQPCLNGGFCVNLYGGYSCVCPAGYRGKNCQDVLNKCSYKPCKNNATCERSGDFLSNYTCSCKPGWTGRNCTQDFNECASNPCLNGATCQNLFNKYVCNCDIGWNGTRCETNINVCDVSPCKNNATCTDLQTRLDYTCTCAPGFTGKNCTVNINDCVRLNANCNNGICVDQVGSFYCNCSEGWYGKNCDTNRDICSSRPCLNSAICENVNTTSGFVCTCQTGWTGVNCGVNINDCAGEPCQNGGTCNDYLNYYNCTCIQGYTGRHCEIDINECLSRPCLNNATCSNEIGRFRCSCLQGYNGVQCENNINECVSTPCFNNATCNDGVNRYTCQCLGGYVGVHCEIEKCRTNPCQNLATCIQRPDRYICNCLPGYTGQDCEVNINECTSNPCKNNASCTDNVNSYRCSCVNGFTGMHCETHLCDTNICKNNASCHRTPSGYSCTCTNGFTGQNCDVNINECLSNPCNATGSLNCTDLIGRYKCYCKGGYVGVTCNNHTCDAQKPCKNDAQCLRLPDRYQCVCQPGFTGRNCEIDINECSSNPCNIGTCNDRINGYTCNCSVMYTGARCETNMNICASNPCLNNATCTNNFTSLSYKCHCLGGYAGQRCESHLCDTIKPCLNNATCLKLPRNYSCQCVNGFTGSRCEYEINECSSAPCLNGGVCFDQRNSFRCSCPLNYTGNRCETFLDYCSPNPCNLGNCTSNYLAQTYNCTCPPAYSGRNCELHICNISNPCQNGATCISDPNRAICNCSSGFTGQNCSVNINECSSNPCLNNGSCVDAVNSYSCTCTTRFTGPRCESVADFCTPSPCRNSGTCINDFANGSHRCICPPYATGRNCEIYLGPCYANPCLSNGNCTETTPTSFRCSCAFGYNGTTCEGITCPCLNNGRCASFDGAVKCICPNDYSGTLCESYYGDCRNNVTRKCSSDSFCKQTSNGYVCQCPAHVSGDRQCNRITNCNPSPCLNNAACISSGFTTLECRCPRGITGQFCQFDINECASSPCLNGGQCRETGFGNFSCYCPARYFGNRCQNRTRVMTSYIPVATSYITSLKSSVVRATGSSIVQDVISSFMSNVSTPGSFPSLTFPHSTNIASASHQFSTSIIPTHSLLSTNINILPTEIRSLTRSVTPVSTLIQTTTRRQTIASMTFKSTLIPSYSTPRDFSSIYSTKQTSNLPSGTDIPTQFASYKATSSMKSSIDSSPMTSTTSYYMLSGKRTSMFASVYSSFSSAFTPSSLHSIGTAAESSSFRRLQSTEISVRSDMPSVVNSTLVQVLPSSFSPSKRESISDKSSFFIRKSSQVIETVLTSKQSSLLASSVSTIPTSKTSSSNSIQMIATTSISSIPTHYVSETLSSSANQVINTTSSSAILSTHISLTPTTTSSAIFSAQISLTPTTSSPVRSSSQLHTASSSSASKSAAIIFAVSSRTELPKSSSISYEKTAVLSSSTNLITISTAAAMMSSPILRTRVIESERPSSSLETLISPIRSLPSSSIPAGSTIQSSVFSDTSVKPTKIESLASQSTIKTELKSSSGITDISRIASIASSVRLSSSQTASIFSATQSVVASSSVYIKDPCLPNPCLQNGNCTRTSIGNFNCQCPLGFGGLTCNSLTCQCQNNGRCVRDSVSLNYRCICKVGFTGTLCENRTSDCRTDSCSGNGVCTERLEGFVCVCRTGFYGIHCNESATACVPGICQNGAICISRSNATGGGFTCACSPGHQGQFCQFDYNECASGPCLNGGKCREDTINSYICYCPSWSSGDQCQSLRSTFAVSSTHKVTHVLSYSTSHTSVQQSLRSTFVISSTHTVTHVLSYSTSNTSLQQSLRSTFVIPTSHTVNSALSYPTLHTSKQQSDAFSSQLLTSTTSVIPSKVTTRLLHQQSSTVISPMPTLSDNSYATTFIAASSQIITPSVVPTSTLLVHPTLSSLSTLMILGNSSVARSFQITDSSLVSQIPSSYTYSFALSQLASKSDVSASTHGQQSSGLTTTRSNLSSIAMGTSSVVHNGSSPLATATTSISKDTSAFISLVPTTDTSLRDSTFKSSIMSSASTTERSSYVTVSLQPETTASEILSSRTEAITRVTSTQDLSTSIPATSSSIKASPSYLTSSTSIQSSVIPTTTPIVPTTRPIRNLTCADRPCNGYPCYNESTNGFEFRCECPYPTFGPRCIQGITIHFPLFNGHSYLEYAPIKYADVINTIVLTFRTTNKEGLLLYAGHNTYKDFIVLQVVGGHLEFRFDAGADSISIRSLERVDGGNLITAIATHDSRTGTGTLSVNGSSPISRFTTTPFKSIQLSTAWYLGGIPSSFRPLNSSNQLPTFVSLVGCIRDIQVNAQPYRVIDARSWLSIGECDVPACKRGPCRNNATCMQNQENSQQYTCQCGTGYLGTDCTEREAHCQGDPCNGGTCVWTPTGHICLCQFGRHGPSCLSTINITTPIFNHVYNYSSYIEYPWRQTMRNAAARFEIRMQFKFNTNDARSFRNGILAFAAQSTIGAPGDDFFALGIINNHTYLLYNLGGGVASVRSIRQIDRTRTWHLVVAGRTGRSGYMYIDDQPAVNILSPGVLIGLDAYTPLYIGGVPDFSKLPSIVRAYFSSGFIGTIYDASFRTAGTSLTALLTNATGTGTHGVNGVAVERGLNIGDDVVNECSPNPCKNNGTCSQKGAQFECRCPTGWTGLTCQDRRIPCIDYNPCSAGSVCRSDANGINCDCPLGKMGTYCDQAVNISQPYFKQNSFMGFTRPNVKHFTKVYIRFKAAKLDGLLFYVSEKIDSSNGDYFAISLWNGYVYVRFNLGLGMTTMRSRKTITLRQWHSLYVERRNKEAIMRLDSNMYIGVRSSGAYSQLNVGSIVYLGGLPRLSSLNPAAVKDVTSQRDFQGTVSHFIVNNEEKVLNTTKAVIGRNIEDGKSTCILNECKNGAVCSIKISSALYSYTCLCTLGWQGALCDQAMTAYSRAKFKGDGYIFYQDSVTTPTFENDIEFNFNTSSDGLLTWFGQLRTNKTDYLAVGVNNSRLRLSFDTGSGPTEVIMNQVITDGKSHKVVIRRDGSIGTVLVILNGFMPVFKSVISVDKALDNDGHFYIGGLDGNVNTLTKGQYTTGLNGCVWDVKVKLNSHVLNLNKNSANRGLNVMPCS